MKKAFYVFICFMTMFFVPVWVSAQTGDLPCDGKDPFEECPIDSDVAFLVAGGLGLAWFTLKSKNLNLINKR